MRFSSAWAHRVGIALAIAIVSAATVAPAGAGEVTFRFRAPEGARLVTVAGTFNGWNSTVAPMSDPDGDGVFETTLRVAEGTQQYKFVVNGTDWYHDENASAFVDDGFGGKNSVMQVGVDAMTVGDAADAAPAMAGTKVVFRFTAEGHVNSVSVVGSFNKWDAAATVMQLNEGVWEATLILAPGEHRYQFVVDGERWLGDPSAKHSEDDGFGGRNALLVVRDDPMTVGPATTRSK